MLSQASRGFQASPAMNVLPPSTPGLAMGGNALPNGAVKVEQGPISMSQVIAAADLALQII
jgi:hypothetical protein